MTPHATRSDGSPSRHPPVSGGRSILASLYRTGVRVSTVAVNGRTFLAALLVALIGSTAVAAELLRILAVRVEGSGATMRLELDLSRKAPIELYALDQPYRLLLDLPDARWEAKPVKVPPRRGLIQDVRFGHVADGRSRLVVGLSGPFRVASSRSTLRGPGLGARLSLELTAIGRSAFERRAPPSTDRAPAPSQPRRNDGRIRIVIDPGHGGVDPGAVGADGTQEKDVVLAVAKRLARLLEKSGRYEVVLTREDDVFISLRDRRDLARRAQGDALISLHADSLAAPGARGASVYTLSEQASDEEAARLAHQENKADIVSGLDLADHDPVVGNILIDLAKRDTVNRSIALADRIVEAMGRATLLARNERRAAGFAVLKSIEMPSVLIELGFLSNPEDASLLSAPRHQTRLAEAIVRGLDQFFAKPKK